MKVTLLFGKLSTIYQWTSVPRGAKTSSTTNCNNMFTVARETIAYRYVTPGASLTQHFTSIPSEENMLYSTLIISAEGSWTLDTGIVFEFMCVLRADAECFGAFVEDRKSE